MSSCIPWHKSILKICMNLDCKLSAKGFNSNKVLVGAVNHELYFNTLSHQFELKPRPTRVWLYRQEEGRLRWQRFLVYRLQRYLV
ncbi:unnamed protein product [Calypogeia fissa]